MLCAAFDTERGEQAEKRNGGCQWQQVTLLAEKIKAGRCLRGLFPLMLY